MNISNGLQRFLLTKFPTLKFSYEKISHKKISFNNNQIFMSIPKGNKYYAWFYNNKGRNYCYLLTIDKKQRYNINNINVYNCCFHNNLTIGIGTILYGTIININNRKLFNIENIYYYKGNYCFNKTFNNKLKIMLNFLSNIRQVNYTNNDITFGSPILSNNYDDILKSINNLNYMLYSIKVIDLYNNNNFSIHKKINIKNTVYCNFIIKSNTISDIYELYYLNDGKLIYYNNAYIDTYNTSKYMNSIFRVIKENNNLDYLEESDDEDDFENISNDKYLLNKTIIFKCIYIDKFKLWKPIDMLNIINNLNDIHFYSDLISNSNNIPYYNSNFI